MASGAGGGASRTWIGAVLLALIFAGIRVVGTMGPPGLRWVMPVGFAMMALLPFLLLDAVARREAGLKWSGSGRDHAIALATGAAAALVCFALGVSLYGASADNWFVSIANGYRRMMDTTGWDAERLHLVFTAPALIFSPVGEEIFFRGYLQYAFERRFSERMSTMAECAAFATIHLCHHGLAWSAAGLQWRPVSAAIWMLLMFGTAWLFARLRQRSGSLVPAIGAHAAFNLVMNLTIFGALWERTTAD